MLKKMIVFNFKITVKTSFKSIFLVFKYLNIRMYMLVILTIFLGYHYFVLFITF